MVEHLLISFIDSKFNSFMLNVINIVYKYIIKVVHILSVKILVKNIIELYKLSNLVIVINGLIPLNARNI